MNRTVSMCFDDGFEATARAVRDVFEARDLRATFCVLAAPEQTADPFIRARPVADWGWWRETAGAGHAVEAHGWAHERLGDLSLAEACNGVDRTLEVFRRELPGFDPARQVFHLAYLAAPQGVVDYVAARSLGVRRALGGAGLNPSPRRDIDCITFGDPADERLTARIDRFLDAEAGWLVLVLHGLDGEGWGPVRRATLEAQLDRLLAAGVEVAPPRDILLKAP
ncbi:MAG: polysaccharide deacetylase family protein [Phenylobacterium sp.]|nr:polysaccharide deacetylase family protein [Phenylobacterium sp.]